MKTKFIKNKFYNLSDLNYLLSNLALEEWHRSLNIRDALLKELENRNIDQIPGAFLEDLIKSSPNRPLKEVVDDYVRLINSFSLVLKEIKEGKRKKYEK